MIVHLRPIKAEAPGPFCQTQRFCPLAVHIKPAIECRVVITGSASDVHAETLYHEELR